MKLLLLDKDNTLIRPTSGEFVDAPWHQEPLPNVAETLHRKLREGWRSVIISNQAGIEAGHKSLEQTFLEFRYCLGLLPEIDEAYFCPSFDGAEAWQVWGDCKDQHRILCRDGEIWGGFRKPSPGMLRVAIATHCPSEVLYVGDRPEDQQAAQAAQVPFQWAKDFFV